MDGERFRVKVTVATAIPEEEVRAANLDHLDPADVDIAAWGQRPKALDPDGRRIPRRAVEKAAATRIDVVSSAG